LRIIGFPHEMTVRLQTLNGKLLETPYHISRLKAFVTPARPKEIHEEAGREALQASANDSMVTGEPETFKKRFEVDSIVGHRHKDGQREYQVKWAGFNTSENTWEPLEHLDNCADKLDEYLKNSSSLKCSACQFVTNGRKGLRNHIRKNHEKR
jgi:hypothetical protein